MCCVMLTVCCVMLCREKCVHAGFGGARAELRALPLVVTVGPCDTALQGGALVDLDALNDTTKVIG